MDIEAIPPSPGVRHTKKAHTSFTKKYWQSNRAKHIQKHTGTHQSKDLFSCWQDHLLLCFLPNHLIARARTHPSQTFYRFFVSFQSLPMLLRSNFDSVSIFNTSSFAAFVPVIQCLWSQAQVQTRAPSLQLLFTCLCLITPCSSISPANTLLPLVRLWTDTATSHTLCSHHP